MEPRTKRLFSVNYKAAHQALCAVECMRACRHVIPPIAQRLIMAPVAQMQLRAAAARLLRNAREFDKRVTLDVWRLEWSRMEAA